MKIQNNIIQVGSRIRLLDNLHLAHFTYTKGHEFTIEAEGERGFDLVDDDGNHIYETRMVHHLYELINNQ